MFLFYFIAFLRYKQFVPECKECLIKLRNIVPTVIDLAVIFRVVFALLSRDCWQIRFHVPLVCLWILGFLFSQL